MFEINSMYDVYEICYYLIKDSLFLLKKINLCYFMSGDGTIVDSTNTKILLQTVIESDCSGYDYKYLI